MSGTNEQVLAWLKNAEDLTIFAHVSPDGDTIGSSLALWHALGRQAQLVCEDPIPEKYAFLPGAQAFVLPAGARASAYALAVDAADAGRLGAARALFEAAAHTAVIDHHGTNPGYAQVCRVEPELGATGTLVREILRDGGWQVDADIALCLYVAISTDMGNFSFSSTKRRDMLAVADLVEMFDLAETTRKLFRMKRKEHTLLLGAMLSAAQFAARGRVAYGCVTREMLARAGAQNADIEGLIDSLINMEGVEVALLFSQRESTKLSIRTLQMDAAALAQRYGGGGHVRAAGATLDCPLEEAVRRVVKDVEAEME